MELINYLTLNVNKCTRKKLKEYAEHLKDYYIPTRYPDTSNGNDTIPADSFTTDQAEKAVLNAKEVLNIATETIEHA